jgi:hypothetical protein
MLWVVRAVNRGKLHTPKYHRANRPLRLTAADVQRLLDLKLRMNAHDNEWVFPNTHGTGPLRHEDLLSRRIQPVAKELGLTHITWRLLRHWGRDPHDGVRCARKGGTGASGALTS